MRRLNDPIKILPIFGNYKIVVPTTVETQRRLHHFILYFSVKRIVIISQKLNHGNLK